MTEGLTEDEIQEVSAEVATMIQSITKRYKLDVMLPAEPVVKEEPVAEEKAEEPAAEEPAEEVKEEKPKRRGRTLISTSTEISTRVTIRRTENIITTTGSI